MKILLTNDDGFGEPGLEVLTQLCAGRYELVIVAPSAPQSGVGHSVTESAPLQIEERAPGRFALAGTPADCVRVGLTQIAPDADWVLAGINAGANLGIDTYVSGTVAAAREAASLGRPAAALSQYIARFQKIAWNSTHRRAEAVLTHILGNPPEQGAFWNANLPHPPDDATACEIVECRVDSSPASVRYETHDGGFVWDGDFHGRPRRSGHDIDVCFGGRISLSLLRL